VAQLDINYRNALPGTWSAWQSLRRPRAGLVAAVLGGVLTVVEGNPRSSQEEWDGLWILREHQGDGMGVMGSGFGASNAEVYMVGGVSGGRTGAISRYRVGLEPEPDPVANVSPCKFPSVGLFGDDLHILGGDIANGSTAARWLVNVQTGTVTPSAAISYPVAGAATVQVDSRLWLLGGYTANFTGVPQAIATVGSYDSVAGSVLRSGSGAPGAPPALPEARHSAAAARLGSRIFLAGGVGASGELLDTVLVLDTTAANPSWQVLTRLPTPRALLALVVYDGFLLAIGGQGAERRALTRVEAYRL
jgi:hypothetical protein